MASVSSTCLEPIAIIGIACEFAGDIHCASDLWQALKESRDVGSIIPRDRFDLESYSAHMLNMDNHGQLHQKLLRRGYFLSNNQWDMFDASFFGLSDAEAGSIDPCHRLLMLKFVHLLDDAGYSMEKVNGSRTSVYIGQFSTDHAATSFRMEPEHRSRFHGPNSLLYNAAARLSYHFNLRGPNVSLDAACSSSLQTVHMAVQTLRTSEADMVVCGGVNGLYAPENFLWSSLISAQSPDGRSRSFSSDANGYAKGDGLGLLLLKRLSDAERDGDRIYCIIRDVLSGHDGNEDKNSYVVPSAAGQARLLNDIYKHANVDPQRIFYVEAHGTGTLVGDPIEANCLGQFFNRSTIDPPLLIGSVKSNLGHTEGTAGIAGLIKIAMCMRHRAIPSNMHFTSLNPKIEAKRYNLHVVQHYVPFPSYADIEPIAIGINSFGIGGNNAHAIVEEYRSTRNPIVNGYREENKQYIIFIFSTKSSKSLKDQIVQFNQWLEEKSFIDTNNEHAFLQHISQQLLLHRTISHTNLCIFVFADRKQLQEQINAFLVEQTIAGLSIASRPTESLSTKICFVFSGQGPQWWAMGRQLYESEPVFTQWIQLIDKEMSKINNGEWRLLEELIEKKNEQESRINDTNIAQPTLFAIQVALAALLVSWNIYPSTIISHSAGDQAAAFVTGRLSLQEAVRIVYHRSRLQNRNTRQGGQMLAVSMSEEEVQEKLLQGIEHLVSVAVVNSPRSVTLSGDEKIIHELQQILSTLYPNVFKARLRIENAFHSHQMDRFNIEKEMLSSLKDIRGLPLQDAQQIFDPKCAQAHLYSSVIGNKLSDDIPVDAHYWWTNVRHCVRFRDAIASIIKDDAADIFFEISPHPVLATSIRECYESSNHRQPLILPTLKRKENEQITLLTSIAQLTASTDMWQKYFDTRNILATKENELLLDDFPLYTFDLSSCWYESKDSVMKRLANRIPTHPLLGVRQLTGQTTATWKSLININLPQYTYLKDHKIQDSILFPAVAYLELATAACRQLLSSVDDKQPTIIFENIKFSKALVLSEHELTEVFTQIIMPMQEWYIYSRPWSSAGSDCMRSSGMSSIDILNSFDDQQTLSQYSLSEFTLHAHGRIETDHTSQKSTTLFNCTRTPATWSTHDITSIYTHLSTRGYQYGPSFQNMRSLQGTTSTVVAKISSDSTLINDLHCYNLYHPTLLDACLHPCLTLLPGIDTTFIPVSIEKFITKSNVDTYDSNIEVHGNYYDNICGLNQERTYTVDLMVIPNDIAKERAMCIFQGFVLQQIQSVQSGRWIREKSIFDNLNAAIDLPNIDRRKYLDAIMKDYCMKRTWTESSMITSAANLLPSPLTLVNSQVNIVINQDLIESIEPFNELAACYAQMAIEGLDTNVVDHHYRPLFDTCHSLATILHEKVTHHSTQIRLMQLLDRFPRLKPLLIPLNAHGSHLKHVFRGHPSKSSIFFGNDETGHILQQFKNIISANKTQMIFDTIARHFQNAHEQIKDVSLNTYRLRILWFAAGEFLDILPILQLLLNLSDQTGLWIDLYYVDADLASLTQAEQAFQSYLTSQTRVSVTYDQTVDLSDSETFDKIPVESFEIIFAANQLKRNQDLTKILAHLRCLLVPNGILLLLELIDVPLYFDIILGLIDEWWSPADNTRALNSVHQWTSILKETGGFVDVQLVPSQFQSTLIIAQKTISQEILRTLSERQHQAWLLFARNDSQSLGHEIASLLPCSYIQFFDFNNRNIRLIRSIMQMMATTYKQLYIVFAWPFEQTPHDDNTVTSFKQNVELICWTFIQLLQIVQTIPSRFRPFIFVITRNAQLNSDSDCNVLIAPLIGLVRSLIAEYEPHRLKLIDLQSSSSSLLSNEVGLIPALIQYMITCRYTNNTDEIVLHLDASNNQVKHITWYYEMLQTSTNKEEESKLGKDMIIPRQDPDQKPFRLHVPTSRFLTDLTWIPDHRPKELLPGKLEVRVQCVGINFRDVLKARGLYPHTHKFAQLDEHQPHADRDTEPGSDFVGIVVRSCPGVSIQPGDHVLGISVNGVFHSHAVVDSSQVVPIPSGCPLTDEQLSAMPTVCLTVIYSLKYRVHLRRDQTVLIHAATGGAGQICIQYCQYIGARIIATAGTEEKRRFLREHYGIEHVFNSRDTSFVNGVRSVVPNGVDIVINSLSGSLLQESVKLLAHHGHFVEWGKRDIYGKSQLSMFELRSDCSFHVIDLVSLALSQLNCVPLMLQEMIDLCLEGKLKPIESTVIYEPSKIIEAFMKVSSGQVIGKTVIRLTNSDEPLALNTEQFNNSIEGNNDTMFTSEVCRRGTILISGGFGGLGLAMTRWMIEKRDIKRVILLSRRTLAELEQPSNPQYEEWLRVKQTINQYNAYVDVLQIDVTNFDQVHSLIERLNQTPYPVRGIIHSAAVVEDLTLANMTEEHLTRVTSAKVHGAWILHQATQLTNTPVHFFIMFSSIRNHLLELASASYNAANQFLDALAHYRMTKLKLPALSVSLPAVSGAGMFHRQRDLLANFQATHGFETVPTVTVFELIERFYENEKTCSCPIIFTVNWQTLYERRHKLPLFQLSKIVEERYKTLSLENTSSTLSGPISRIDLNLSTKESIIERTQAAVARLLGASTIDRILIDRSLISQGMDSLAALSLYNWLGQETGIYIPMADLLQGLSIENIASVVHNKFYQQQQIVSTTTKEYDIDVDLIKENEVNITGSLIYTGTENIICLGSMLQNTGSVLFYITNKPTIDINDSFRLHINKKLFSQQSPKASVITYAIQIPSMPLTTDISKYARNMILQIRRIQPRGPYQLMALELFVSRYNYKIWNTDFTILLLQKMLSRKQLTVTVPTTVQNKQGLEASGRTEAVASLVQQRIYLHEKLYFSDSNISVYNILVPLMVQCGSEQAVLRSSVRYNPGNNQVEQLVQDFDKDIYSFQHSHGILTPEQLDILLTSELTGKYFDVEKGRVTRCHVIQRNVGNSDILLQQGDCVIFNIHHIALDNVSLKLFVQAFEKACWADKSAQSMSKVPQYIDYTIYEQALLVDPSPNAKMNKARLFWNNLLDGYDWNKVQNLMPDQVRSSQIRYYEEDRSRGNGVTLFDMTITISHSHPPASYAQGRIWLDEQMRFDPDHPQVAIYNMPFVYHLSPNNTISVKQLQHALYLTVNKHLSLHTAFIFDKDKNILMQRVMQNNSTISFAKRNAQLFNLAQGLVFRCHLVYYKQISFEMLLSEKDVIIFNFHHAVFDFPSMNIFVHDLNQAYITGQLLDGNNETNLRYLDYAAIEQQIPMTGAQMFWLDTLHNSKLDQSLSLPYDRYRLANEHRTGRGTSISFDFGQDLSRYFLSYASTNNMSLEYLSLITYFIFLFKLTNGEKDLCIGMNTEGRYRDELQSIIGMFVNATPLRCQLNPHLTFHTFFEQMRSLISNTMKYSYFPLQRILAQHPHLSNPAFLDTSFEFIASMANVDENKIMLGDNALILAPYSIEISEDEIMSKFDFILSFNYNSNLNELSCKIDASLDLFHVETVTKISQQFHSMLHQLSTSIYSQSKKPLYELSITLPYEHLLLQSMNNTEISFPSVKCIHHEFALKAITYPQKLAVELDEQSLTYCELLYYVQVLSLNLLNEYHISPGPSTTWEFQ
ncbi:hypothetical protein I4U23_011163 [Adineta vaga]|nr:hypothetical protein I4U23_011163 [Adineta vaga]